MDVLLVADGSFIHYRSNALNIASLFLGYGSLPNWTHGTTERNKIHRRKLFNSRVLCQHCTELLQNATQIIFGKVFQHIHK